MLFASGRSDALEHLFAESLSCQSTDHIDSCFLLPDIGNPLKEDVLFLGDVDVAGATVLEGGKRSLEVGLNLVPITFG